MVTTTSKKRGPRDTADWERLRAAFWAYEIQRQAQAKMSEQRWDVSDPFMTLGRLILVKWQAPQRQTQNHGIVSLNDLSELILGAGRTDLYHYAKGTMARPKASIINQIDLVLPGTQSVFDVGPEGVPLWAVLTESFTVVDFWVPLARTGQVTDALELLSGLYDWTTVETDLPLPKLTPVRGKVTGMALRDALTFEATCFLPFLSLSRIVAGLVFCVARRHFQGSASEDFNASMVNMADVNCGIATLAVAVGLRALKESHDLFGSDEGWNNPNAAPDAMHHLRELLTGLIPYWAVFDQENGKLPCGMVHVVNGLLRQLPVTLPVV